MVTQKTINLTVLSAMFSIASTFHSEAEVPDTDTGYRTFTNNAGKTIRAKVNGKKGSTVSLRMTNGITYRVAIATLSQLDQEFVASWEITEERKKKLKVIGLNELFKARGFKRVPLQLQHNQILLEVNVTGSKLTFLLDTGAQRSVMDRSRAKALKLKIQEDVGFGSGIAGQTITYGMTLLPSLKIGPVKKNDVTLTVLDLSKFGKENNAGSKFDGIIGFDLLEDFEAVIDYKSAVLYLRED